MCVYFLLHSSEVLKILECIGLNVMGFASTLTLACLSPRLTAPSIDVLIESSPV